MAALKWYSLDHRMFRKIYFVWPRPRSFYSGMIFFFNKPLKLLTKTNVSFNITKTILSTRDTIQTQLNRLKNKPFLKFLVNCFVSEYPRIKESFSAEASAKHSFVRQIHRKQVVAVGWEPQNNSPTACVRRWDQKNWPVRPKKFWNNQIIHWSTRTNSPVWRSTLPR